MKNSDDCKTELEALRTEALRLQREAPQELSPEELQKKKRKRIASNIVFTLFGVMIVLGLLGKIFEKSFLIVAALAVMGLIVVIMAFTGNTQKKRDLSIRYVRIKSRDIITRMGFSCIGLFIIAIVILIAAGYEAYLVHLIFGMLGLFFIITAASGTTPYFYVKKKVNYLKRVCTETVTAVCTDKNKKDRLAIIKEKIELMPVYVNVKNTTCSSLKTRYVRSFCSPVYEIYYGGQTYTLCDNNYNNFRIPEVGSEREILINPDNPQEFYDFTRYKKELSVAFGHAVLSIFAMFPFIMFFVFFILMYNA